MLHKLRKVTLYPTGFLLPACALLALYLVAFVEQGVAVLELTYSLVAVLDIFLQLGALMVPSVLCGGCLLKLALQWPNHLRECQIVCGHGPAQFYLKRGSWMRFKDRRGNGQFEPGIITGQQQHQREGCGRAGRIPCDLLMGALSQ